MPTWYEEKLADMLESIQYELSLGDASKGDLRNIRKCALDAAMVVADYRENIASDGADSRRFKVLSERERAVEGLRAAAQGFVLRGGGMQNKSLWELAVAHALTPDASGEGMAEFLREHAEEMATDAGLHAPNARVQKSIHDAFDHAVYRLAALDQLDWRWCPEAWDTGCVSAEQMQALQAEGGYQAILASPDKQEAWQDLLDHVFNARLYKVIEQVAPGKSYDELRELPWKGVSLDHPAANGHFKIVPRKAGSGTNVVGLTYQLSAGPRVRTDSGWEAPVMIEVDDHMAVDGSQMGKYLRTRLKEAWAQHELKQIHHQHQQETGWRVREGNEACELDDLYGADTPTQAEVDESPLPTP